MAASASVSGERQRRVGRPRSGDHDRRILAAVFEELAERPYSRMSVDDVARRAGVAKTTLYRRYPSKFDLVKAAVEDYYGSHFFALFDHHVVDVMIDALDQLVHEFGSTPAGRALSNLACEAVGDPAMFELLGSGHKRAELRRALRRGVERGELKADTDVEVLLDVLQAVFPYRLIVMNRPIPDDYARRLASLVLRGCLDGGEPDVSDGGR